MDLKWNPPTNDGGSKITGYIVEKKQIGSDFWIKSNQNYPVTDLECQITDLVENAEYEFRVKAVNKAGESEPSISTGKIKITEYPGKIIRNLIIFSILNLFFYRRKKTSIC